MNELPLVDEGRRVPLWLACKVSFRSDAFGWLRHFLLRRFINAFVGRLCIGVNQSHDRSDGNAAQQSTNVRMLSGCAGSDPGWPLAPPLGT